MRASRDCWGKTKAIHALPAGITNSRFLLFPSYSSAKALNTSQCIHLWNDCAVTGSVLVSHPSPICRVVSNVPSWQESVEGDHIIHTVGPGDYCVRDINAPHLKSDIVRKAIGVVGWPDVSKLRRPGQNTITLAAHPESESSSTRASETYPAGPRQEDTPSVIMPGAAPPPPHPSQPFQRVIWKPSSSSRNCLIWPAAVQGHLNNQSPACHCTDNSLYIAQVILCGDEYNSLWLKR